MLPEHVLSSMTDEELTTTEYFNTEPVTLGPYKFIEWRKDEYVAFERNDDWATPATFPKLQLKFLQSDVAAAQLETGDLVASSSIAPLDAKRLAELDSVDVSNSPGVYPEVLQFAVDNPVLQNPLVRQAMMYSIDLDAICEEVMLNYCSVHWNQVRLLAPEWAIPTEGLEPYEYNPDKAKELLAEAGWNPDQKIIIHNIGGADRVRSTEALIIQASFQAVGIKADIVSTDSATFLAMAKDPAQRARLLHVHQPWRSLHGRPQRGRPVHAVQHLLPERCQPLVLLRSRAGRAVGRGPHIDRSRSPCPHLPRSVPEDQQEPGRDQPVLARHDADLQHLAHGSRDPGHGGVLHLEHRRLGLERLMVA